MWAIILAVIIYCMEWLWKYQAMKKPVNAPRIYLIKMDAIKLDMLTWYNTCGKYFLHVGLVTDNNTGNITLVITNNCIVFIQTFNRRNLFYCDYVVFLFPFTK